MCPAAKFLPRGFFAHFARRLCPKLPPAAKRSEEFPYPSVILNAVKNPPEVERKHGLLYTALRNSPEQTTMGFSRSVARLRRVFLRLEMTYS